MNKSVVKKLIKSKMLEAEALKELISDRMPDQMKEKAETIEKEVMEIAKELFWERMTEKSKERYDGENDYEESDYEEEKVVSQKKGQVKKTNKVSIQFGEEEK